MGGGRLRGIKAVGGAITRGDSCEDRQKIKKKLVTEKKIKRRFFTEEYGLVEQRQKGCYVGQGPSGERVKNAEIGRWERKGAVEKVGRSA